MLDAFETRLADLLADLLAGQEEIAGVARAGATSAFGPKGARVHVRVLSGAPRSVLGDDEREALGQKGAYTLRQTLRLEGQVQLELSVLAAAKDPRVALLKAVDRVLLALHAGDVRTGGAFKTDADLGFELDGFRLEGVTTPASPTVDDRRIQIDYRYSGAFWPLAPAESGKPITTVPVRLAVLPAGLPEGLSVSAGGADLDVPITLDLRAMGGATGLLAARLRGAAPPGQLVGGTSGGPPGFVVYAPGEDEQYHLRYRPPATLSGRARVRVELRLAQPDRPTVAVGELSLEVKGGGVP